ncbi:MAG: phosphoribosylformylglycinamidine synthase subunit PurQ [Phycisphaerales bacterium]|nr:phosphoribosylformylglycinamidine synthase subunit PurQ [Phycisphaerales bacterium]
MTTATMDTLEYAADMADRPRALIMTAAGINCDHELAEAFALAGATPEFIHLTTLMSTPDLIDQFDLVGLPGGFSYGDAIAAGRIAAALVSSSLIDRLRAAIDRGVPMIAPCNGFQIAVQAGLLPGPRAGAGARTEAALLENDCGRFIDRWVRVEYPASRCVWTQGITADDEAMLLPVAHGEGRFYGETDLLKWLWSESCVAVQYQSDDDPNGSVDHIAGICDHSGLVLGLMPHPERYLHWTQHPFWTRIKPRSESTPGLQMFQSAVTHVLKMRAGTQA